MSNHSPMSTRRLFLQRGLTLLAVAPTIPAFLNRTVMAMADPLDVKRTQQPSGTDGKILVVVQLSGGNDGLNTVIPYAEDAYYRARPAIGVEAKNVLKVNDHIGLHPNLTGLKGMYDAGMLSILQGVGYPNPNRSHFRSMDIWQSAQPDSEVATSGWLGRYFDNTCTGDDPHTGVSMGETLPLAMRGDRVTALSFEKPNAYRYNGTDRERYEKLNHISGQPPLAAQAVPATQPVKGASLIVPKKPEIIGGGDAQLEFLTRTAMDAQVSSDKILKVTKGHVSPTEYPNNGFGNDLKTVAAMIAGGLPTRVYYVTLGGFDTHAGEKNRHDNLMRDLSAGVDAFWKDLKQQKNDDRVLMMTFSEFGRRVEQNASGGTDHGAAAPMFLMGKAIKEGVVGKHPSLTNLDQGDLKFTQDFRNIYATVLQSWLETPSKPILGEQYNLMSVLKA